VKVVGKGHRVRSQQLSLPLRSRGGWRRGAGRPPKGERAGVAHARRPQQQGRHPLHITLKARRGLPSLRTPALFRNVRCALAAGKERFGFRLIQFSVQRDHIHLLAEAGDARALSRGMQGLAIRIARATNRHLRRSGAVFGDRYHARALTTPRSVRMALRYVLLNASKHERATIPPGFVDPCSSAPWFGGFARPPALAFGAREVQAQWALHGADPPVVPPQTWLLRIGYTRAGPFDIDDELR
jgi:putative transposase